MVRLLRAFWRLDRQDKLVFTAAYCLSGVIRLALLCLPFRWLAVMLGDQRQESVSDETVEAVNTAVQVGRLVKVACRYTLWESKCLVQAVAAKLLLRLYGISNTLYLGVRREEDDSFTAHAWLRCGDRIITGAQGRERYTAVGMFADSKSVRNS